MTTAEYDVIVVGAGLIGSAAARHLVEISTNTKVLLIGPEEPEDWSKADIFSSHYDEARLTKLLEYSPVWTRLAQRSVERYRELERKSGITFYHEDGYLLLGYKNQPSNYDVKTAAEKGEKVSVFNHQEMKQKFPYLSTTDEQTGTYQNVNSGYINPRLMVKAQKRVAKQLGCDVINDVVKRITPNGSGGYQIESEAGQVVRGKKVLLSTGCFTHCRNLLPKGLELDLTLNGTTYLLAEVDESELPRLRGMPAMCVDEVPGSGYMLRSYLLPPIRYPDGKYYLKIGPGRRLVKNLHTAHQVAEWYRHGHDNRQHRFLMEEIHSLFPDILFRNFRFGYCITTSTPSGHVMIDLVAPGMGVAVAGNGCGAKSADEIGRVAARMMLKGSWDYDVPQDVFKAKFKSTKSKM